MTERQMETRPTNHLSHEDGCMQFLEVSEGGRMVKYIGRGRDDLEAASVRSSYPLSPAPLPIGYFEAHVVNAGRDGYMSIGLMNPRTPLDKLVGWSEGAIGYHGDDGNVFIGTGLGSTYGPTFSTGNTVGCCIDWVSDVVFFTKDGSILGSLKCPFAQDELVHAAVGLRTPNEALRLNFGLSPFIFDLDGYVRKLRDKVFKVRVDSIFIEHETVLKTIINHCIHWGCPETVKELSALFPDNSDQWIGMAERRLEERLFVKNLSLFNDAVMDDKIATLFPTALNSAQFLLYWKIFLFNSYCYHHPNNSEQILQRGLALKDFYDQSIEKPLSVDSIFKILVYKDPRDSKAADQIFTTWRDTIAQLLEDYSSSVDSVRDIVSGLQHSLLEAASGSRSKHDKRSRFLCLMDDAEFWMSKESFSCK